MTDTKALVALTALNAMMAKGHFSICTIDAVAEMLGVNPKGDAYRTLRPLHCVNFSDMPAELRGQIPGLIRECLDVEPTYQFPAPARQPAEPGRVVTIPGEPPRGLLRRMLG